MRKTANCTLPTLSRLLNWPIVSSRLPDLRRQPPANPQRDCQLVPHREGHVLEHPALAPSHLDLAPWNKQWRVHEPKKEHASQIQTLLTDSKRQHVVIVCQPPHLAALPSPFRSVERNSCAIEFRQREPSPDEADDCAYQKPQRNEVNGEDGHKQRGMLIDETL